MREKGFAIRCPSCLQWQVYERHPRSVALRSAGELRKILSGLSRNPETFEHRKLLRCNQPLHICPAPSEAFVCRNDEQAQLLLQGVEAWSLKRDFRLCKDTTGLSRWPRHVGVLFNALPVKRQRLVELGYLLDPLLLAQANVGIGEELQGPLTVFAAQTFEHKKRLVTTWVPIEAYARWRTQVPPRFNQFCQIVRETVAKQLVSKFLARRPSTRRCPLGLGVGKTCAGRKAACVQKDWGECPAFLELVRRERCPCYGSDRRIIGAVQRKWLKGDVSPTVRRCWAGLTEIAFPIVVHGLLVGVAMAGQLVVGASRPRSLQVIMRASALLKPARDRLARARDVLAGILPPDPSVPMEHYSVKFRVGEKEKDRLILSAQSGVQRIADVAGAQYHRVRARSETAFRQELTGRIETEESREGFTSDPLLFFGGPLLEILRRMRQFWALKAAYLMVVQPKSKDLCMVALSKAGRGGRHVERALGFPGKRVSCLDLKQRPQRPQPCLYRPSEHAGPKTALAKDLVRILRQAMGHKSFAIPQSPFYFSVIVPVAGHLFAFLFAGRDKKGLSALSRRKPGTISDLAQEMIFGACTEVVRALGEIWFRGATEKAWKEFARLACHRMGNELSAVGSILSVLQDEMGFRKQAVELSHEDLLVMLDAIRSATKMLVQQAELTKEVVARPKRVCTRDLITRVLAGAVPDTARVSVRIGKAAERIRVDGALIEQALRELARNAVQMGGARTRITIRVAVTSKAASEWRKFPERHLEISCRNTGVAITGKDAERIFEPFFSSRPGKMGLGLNTVRQNVEAHGGIVRARPWAKGGHFVILMPAFKKGGRPCI
ncbi:MAG TPA: ATP-binding protein [Phycisphaerae bacterium]|nr:ATP-binding protein [Phycisphaerae bacterium]